MELGFLMMLKLKEGEGKRVIIVCGICFFIVEFANKLNFYIVYMNSVLSYYVKRMFVFFYYYFC